MRNYPRNSPEAAARILALVLIADGHVCRTEVDALHRLQVEQELGLASGGFAQVMQALCEDLLMGAESGGALSGSIEDSTLACLMAEVDSPVLQHLVLRLAGAAAEADRHLAEAEALVIAATRRHWRLGEAPIPSVRPLAELAAN